jgi:hypothetical protein
MGDNGLRPALFPRRLPNGRTANIYYEPFPPNYFAPGPGHEKLDVAIIGAGIAGLIAAVALAQSGHCVEVRANRGWVNSTAHEQQLYEKSQFANEIGAAINVCPNAARILSYFEFDFSCGLPTQVDEVSTRSGCRRTLELCASS